MSRGLPDQHRRTTRRTRVAPAAGARAQHRTTTAVDRHEVVVSWCPTHDGTGACWCDGAAQMPAEHHPQDIPPGTGAQAAHVAAGRHDGHSTDDSTEHHPWHHTQHGVICSCGRAMTADEQCPAAPTEETETP